MEDGERSGQKRPKRKFFDKDVNKSRRKTKRKRGWKRQSSEFLYEKGAGENDEAARRKTKRGEGKGQEQKDYERKRAIRKEKKIVVKEEKT